LAFISEEDSKKTGTQASRKRRDQRSKSRRIDVKTVSLECGSPQQNVRVVEVEVDSTKLKSSVRAPDPFPSFSNAVVTVKPSPGK
jgi:hypothetical protein